eukprot:3785344-Rhodomonas_salina.2
MLNAGRRGLGREDESCLWWELRSCCACKDGVNPLTRFDMSTKLNKKTRSIAPNHAHLYRSNRALVLCSQKLLLRFVRSKSQEGLGIRA